VFHSDLQLLIGTGASVLVKGKPFTSLDSSGTWTGALQRCPPALH
jgi:hypothetical protein